MIFDYKRKAKSISYGRLRSLRSIQGIVVHYTSNRGDSAMNNADFFATGNDRYAGAHIFIDRAGLSAYSVPIRRVAYSVGNPNGSYRPGAFYSILNNTNTVSIELCDLIGHPVNFAQKKTLIKIVKWLKKKCPNIKYIVRHYDIVQKICPEYYVENRQEWLVLQKELEKLIKG